MVDRADIVQDAIGRSRANGTGSILESLVSSWNLEQEESVSRAPLDSSSKGLEPIAGGASMRSR